MAIQTEDDAAAADGGMAAALRGVIAGLIGAVVAGLVIHFGFDPSIIADDIAGGLGLAGLPAGWAVLLVIGVAVGLVYAGLARLDRLRTYAAHPQSGVALGLAYGVVIWVLAVIAIPLLVAGGGVGDYAVNWRGLLSYALLGVVIGLVYAVAPMER